MLSRTFRPVALAFAALAAASLESGTAGAQGLLPSAAWNGPYWGVHADVAWANARQVRSARDLAWGAQVGYGLQLNLIYIGLEADATYGGLRTSSYLTPLYSSTLEVDWSATARARAGLAIGDALLYVTGGVAWSAQTYGIHTLGSPLSSEHRTVAGIVYGAGLEIKPLPFLAARIEGLRTDFSTESGPFPKALPAALAPSALKALNADETVVRASINIRLN